MQNMKYQTHAMEGIVSYCLLRIKSDHFLRARAEFLGNDDAGYSRLISSIPGLFVRKLIQADNREITKALFFVLESTIQRPVMRNVCQYYGVIVT